jgi:crotonobetainyl-CoA:carnitine CoA-transferase CaiB-like acyl-CoA transferase
VQYPIIPVADGHVRLCILAPRQWQGMHRMMGEPPEFSDPKYLDVMVRFKDPDLLPAMARFLADKTRAEIEALGQQHGVPLAGLLSLSDCLAADHIRARSVFAEVDLPSGQRAPFPDGLLVVDGNRMGPVHKSEPAAPRTAPAARPKSSRPLEGIKVLDLGVIVVGAETGRLLADLGAEVVKIESQAFPDGSRQTYLKIGLSAGFGAGHRNKRSLGLNLKSNEGKALLCRMVAKADVVLSNFKPGTMETLGLGFAELSAINPRVIAVESSAFGATGPWAKRMGYGPLVRAAAGLTRKWCYPDDPDGFSDSVTIYPDHVGGRIGATAVMALLARRMRTGRGGHADVSQAEVMLSHLATEIAGTALGVPGIAHAPDAPWGVFPAEGEDEWCVVTVRNDADWRRLADVIGAAEVPAATRSERLTHKIAIEAQLARWLAVRDAQAAAQSLQAAGVPAARMLRVADQPDHPYFVERGLFRTDVHPLLPEPMVAERRPALWQTIPDAGTSPAPLMGADTFAVMHDWLQLDDTELARLEAEGVLEGVPEKVRAMTADISNKETAR